MPDSITDIILTGIPRSGTSLTCHLLDQLPNTLALIEPMDMQVLMACPDRQHRQQALQNLFAQIRQDAAEGVVQRRPIAGSGTNTFAPSLTGQGKRQALIAPTATVEPLAKPLTNNFYVAVKHPNAFSALLPELVDPFRCFAIVRNPIAVLASWHSLEHPLAEGRAPMAEAFDPELATALKAQASVIKRQILLLDWYFQRYQRYLPSTHIIHYEDILNDPAQTLAVINPLAAQYRFSFARQQVGADYAEAYILAAWRELLCATDHHCLGFYSREQIFQQVLDLTTLPQVPQVNVMIAGAQKCGTTALAHFLDQHPEICLSTEKEVHLFDAVEYAENWRQEQIQHYYRPYFTHYQAEPLVAEASPIYCYWEFIPPQLYRYNPKLKLLILVRDPVARALSHYRMEKGRGGETLSLPMALWRERQRLKRDLGNKHPDSSWRRHSYTARSLFGKQLQHLLSIFPTTQLLVIDKDHLHTHHALTMAQILLFLGVDEQVIPPQETVYHRHSSYLQQGHIATQAEGNHAQPLMGRESLGDVGVPYWQELMVRLILKIRFAWDQRRLKQCLQRFPQLTTKICSEK